MVGSKFTISAAMLLLASSFASTVRAGEMDVPGAGAFMPRPAAPVREQKRATSKVYSVKNDYSGMPFDLHYANFYEVNN